MAKTVDRQTLNISGGTVALPDGNVRLIIFDALEGMTAAGAFELLTNPQHTAQWLSNVTFMDQPLEISFTENEPTSKVSGTIGGVSSSPIPVTITIVSNHGTAFLTVKMEPVAQEKADSLQPFWNNEFFPKLRAAAKKLSGQLPKTVVAP